MRRLLNNKMDLIGNPTSSRSRFACCGKKGAAHFEMIFAFVFFIGFVFFLFIILKPQDTSTLSGSVIEALYDSFEENASTNLSYMFLKANYSTADVPDCFFVNLPGEIFTYTIDDGDNHVTNLAGQQIPAYVDNNDLSVREDGNFFRVSISPEFDAVGEGGCVAATDYELGNVLERKVISHTALLAMHDMYAGGGYEELRTALKVPPIFDFAIIADTMTGVNMEPEDIPNAVDVRAQDYVVEVLKKDGTLTNERFTLKVW